MPSIITRTLAAIGLAAAALVAQATPVSISGTAVYNSDVARLAFDLAATSNVDIWTDSWQAGLNFDPTLALWQQVGADYTLVQEVDDAAQLRAGQGSFDSRINLSNLAAGHYLITLVASPNYANGALLSAGFNFDGQTHSALANWTQPGSDLNANDQKGGFWQVNAEGITTITAVPEPSTWAFMALGLAAIGQSARRRTRA